MRPVVIWKIRCWIHSLAWIYCSCIVFHMAFVLHGSLQYVQRVPYAEILHILPLFRITWYCRVQSLAVFKGQDVLRRRFCWLISLSIDCVWDCCIDRVISTLSCSYCLWNRNCRNHCWILSNFLLFCMIWYGWLQSPAVYKRQNVRWYGFRWSIPISIDYVWSLYILYGYLDY